MAIGLSVIDIFMVLIRKKNLDAVVFELETNDKYIGFYKIIPFILLILAVLSIAVSRNSYLLWLSILMISFALSFAIRGLFFPVGLSEKGLMFFGEGRSIFCVIFFGEDNIVLRIIRSFIRIVYGCQC